MFCAFFSLFLLMLVGGAGVLFWLGWQRVRAHMRKHPEAAKLVAEHVIAPLLTGEPEPEPEGNPQPKKIRGTLV